MSLWDPAVWHSAARGGEVPAVRRAPAAGAVGEPRHHRRREGRTDFAFARACVR
ncbi:hypothetical protein [Streptomyces capoamus]|uniref:hypothetical protein n=1 Tax=Streptomyces capoamus TaxID=68183 RepID=UPI003393197C